MARKPFDIGYYLNLPWTYTVETDIKHNQHIYRVTVNELKSAKSEAPSIDEAMHKVRQSIAMAINMYQQMNQPIPEPVYPSQCKGKILYRTSPDRHFKLIRSATRLKSSLSQCLDQAVDLWLSQHQ